MEQKIKKRISAINILYYGVMIFTVFIFTVGYCMPDIFAVAEPDSQIGQILQYVVIFDALITIPFGLYQCKRKCEKLSLLEDKEKQLEEYSQAACKRIIWVTNSMYFAVIVFLMLGGYPPMLWVAAIGAIGWYFTKPSVRKMELELQPKDPNQENY